MTAPQKRPFSRKKSLLERWSQVRRIKKRAMKGPSNFIFVKEFKPLIEEWMNEESISRNPLLNENVREMARRGMKDADFAIKNKIHEWGLSRALNMTGIFSSRERRMIRTKMDFILTANKNQQMNALIGVRKELGLLQYKKFLAWYNHTVDFIQKRTELLYESLK